MAISIVVHRRATVLPTLLSNVGCWRQSRKHLLPAKYSQVEPISEISMAPLGCCSGDKKPRRHGTGFFPSPS